MATLTTARLRLEPYDERHFDGLHAMNRLPEVMRYITGQPYTEAETRASIARVQQRWAELGYSWWAWIHLDTGQLVGAGTIQHMDTDRASPLEIGWRLHPQHWGQGYATEAAFTMRDWAFDTLKPAELLARCHPQNAASSNVMKRLGMTWRGTTPWQGAAFDCYGLTAAQWQALAQPQAR